MKNLAMGLPRSEQRIVVTGLGVVSPNAIGVDDYVAALRAGTSGVTALGDADRHGAPVHAVGIVRDFEPERYLDRTQIRRNERFVQMAMVASLMAMEDAGLAVNRDVDPYDSGVILGAGMGSISRTEREAARLDPAHPTRVSPLYLAASIPNMAAAQVSMILGMKGYLGTTVTACAAGLQSVGEAYWTIRRGDARMMIAGGAEANISPLYLHAFANMGALSMYPGDPAAASRPFDRDRDGFVMAEGAGVVVLERMDDAVRRGAKVYGEILGFGAGSDAHHVTSPEPSGDGMAFAMKRALAWAGIVPGQVNYINAHGSGTQLNDLIETRAIRSVFGAHADTIPVSSTKSMIGHTLAASGALELIATLLAMKESFAPPTINYRTPDPDCTLDYVPNEARDMDISLALTNSFGFGGQNASMVVQKGLHYPS